jgi:hypothetical protein
MNRAAWHAVYAYCRASKAALDRARAVLAVWPCGEALSMDGIFRELVGREHECWTTLPDHVRAAIRDPAGEASGQPEGVTP